MSAAAQPEIRITLPDGSVRTTTAGSTGADIAAAIGPGLAKAALAVEVDGRMRDLDWPLKDDAKLRIITRKDEAEALDLIRHDTAHLMAQAVQELYPGTQVTIGPNIEDGFFYDFVRDEPFTSDDLPKIEARMHELVKANLATKRTVWPREEAIRHFEGIGEKYKAEIIRDLPPSEDISVYYHGNWHDLCRGPHLPSTGAIGNAFKLTKISGAYWRGDAKNAQLQRIYGTAWRDEKELKAYLTRIEEAEKRDHRKIGKEMDLFHLQSEAHGSVFWHPNGFVIWRALEAYMRRRLDAAGYNEVKTPQVMDARQWEQSGHWGKYRENMFVIPDEIPNTEDEGPLVSNDASWMALKPMNCPGHILIFRQGIKSYRDLPIRMAEFGCCHRNEPHGALHGIMRVRQFTQDDAHIFCREDQIIDEVTKFCDLLDTIYKDLGFDKYAIKLALRPEKRFGTEEMWDQAEGELREAVAKTGRNGAEWGWEELKGEGAFYAPKLEFHLTDAIGRTWQVGTIQSDRVLPERLDATYVGEDGNRHRPVMLHRAILGTYERFIGILIEHYAGKFPMWLAPVQAVVTTIVSDADDYAKTLQGKLRSAGLRADIDLRNEKINYKVREHSLAKVPVMLIAGRREAEEGRITIRRLGVEKQETMTLDDAIEMLRQEALPPDLKAAQSH
ncbi:MAG: threonine--tRNA ligase [Alphaproteobacteria bacterium]|nr:threonine--tRNA ligase [Alphaproteobacteria bacterium]